MRGNRVKPVSFYLYIKPKMELASEFLALAVERRTYSRPLSNPNSDQSMEDWADIVDRVSTFIQEKGKFTVEERMDNEKYFTEKKATPSGRMLWVGGTDWSRKANNSPGLFNCFSTTIESWEDFESNFDYLMQGTGAGSVVLEKNISNLPPILNYVRLKVIDNVGSVPPDQRLEHTSCSSFTHTEYSLVSDTPTVVSEMCYYITVGDSRQGWSSALRFLLESVSDATPYKHIFIDLSNVRPSGEDIKGFGGKANPAGLKTLFESVIKLTNEVVQRDDPHLTSIDCEKILCETAKCVIAGNIRRSARLALGGSADKLFTDAKDNLWQEGSDGKWRIDPDRDSFRMANFTRLFQRKPTPQECYEAVEKQYWSSEGALAWGGEMLARCNADLLDTPEKKQEFLNYYKNSPYFAKKYLGELLGIENGEELSHRMERYGLNPCAEVCGSNFFCNLSLVHLDQLNVFDLEEQKKAFQVAGNQVACLLDLSFPRGKYQTSREFDPIVSVNFTGGFDFFLNLFGSVWLKWWENDRKDSFNIDRDSLFENFRVYKEGFEELDEELDQLLLLYWVFHPEEDGDKLTTGQMLRAVEDGFMTFWKQVCEETIESYCVKRNLKMPNRFTSLQPAGTKSLLTGSTAGAHPPIFGYSYIRRVQFKREHPIALACMESGFHVVPSADQKNPDGSLIEDIYDPRVEDWLVEFPIRHPSAKLMQNVGFDPSKISAVAQFDFAMQVQQSFVTHNTSYTIQFSENEIKPLADAIHDAIDQDKGYISFALMRRFENTGAMPLLPYEPISLERCQALEAKLSSLEEFKETLDAMYDNADARELQESKMFCTSQKCEL